MREKVQGMRNIIGKHKTDRGSLRIEQKVEKPKNLYVPPMNMKGGGGLDVGRKGMQGGEGKGEEKDGTTVVA